MPSLPKNYPFYNWVPKPLGILILILLFVPILTASGVYTANSGEMLSGWASSRNIFSSSVFLLLWVWPLFLRSFTAWFVCAGRR